MNGPSPQEIVALVQKVESATKEERLIWKTTSQLSVFQTQIADSFIQIEESYDNENDDNYYVLTIRNKDGRTLDTISSGAFSTALRAIRLTTAYSNSVDNIYKAARWQALGVSQVYNKLLSSL